MPKFTTAMANIIFTPASADPNKGFRMGHEQSLFVNNQTFTVTGVKYGNYQQKADNGELTDTKYASTSQAILLTTSLGEDLPLNRLLHKRRVIYDKEGKAQVVDAAAFKTELTAHLESLGRRTDDSAMLVGTVEEVGKHALKFFEGKVLQCVEHAGFGRDDKNHLAPLLSPCIQFTFQS